MCTRPRAHASIQNSSPIAPASGGQTLLLELRSSSLLGRAWSAPGSSLLLLPAKWSTGSRLSAVPLEGLGQTRQGSS